MYRDEKFSEQRVGGKREKDLGGTMIETEGDDLFIFWLILIKDLDNKFHFYKNIPEYVEESINLQGWIA